MNKLAIAGVIIIGMLAAIPTLLSPVTAESSINESIQGMKAKQINYAKAVFWNDTTFIEEYDVIYFINVSGSPTYTMSAREFVPVTLELDNMISFNNAIEKAIKQRAKERWNWTLPFNKISYHAYSKAT